MAIAANVSCTFMLSISVLTDLAMLVVDHRSHVALRCMIPLSVRRVSEMGSSGEDGLSCHNSGLDGDVSGSVSVSAILAREARKGNF